MGGVLPNKQRPSQLKIHKIRTLESFEVRVKNEVRELEDIKKKFLLNMVGEEGDHAGLAVAEHLQALAVAEQRLGMVCFVFWGLIYTIIIFITITG